jgi:hypothetical protein
MNSDFSQLTANGASNAIGSMQEFEVLTRDGCPTSVDFAVCYAHQNERSGSKASGTVEFAEITNDNLGDLLKKSHKIQERISRASKRMHAYQQVQKKKECKPLLNPDPANETRWNGCIDVTLRANLIMGDICDTVDALLDPSGDDYSLLTSDKEEFGDISHLSYTDDDKMILQQFEGAATPAKKFSKFLQDRRNAPHYILFEARMAIQSTSANSFGIVLGKLSSLMFMTLLYEKCYCASWFGGWSESWF